MQVFSRETNVERSKKEKKNAALALSELSSSMDFFKTEINSASVMRCVSALNRISSWALLSSANSFCAFSKCSWTPSRMNSFSLEKISPTHLLPRFRTRWNIKRSNLLQCINFVAQLLLNFLLLLLLGKHAVLEHPLLAFQLILQVFFGNLGCYQIFSIPQQEFLQLLQRHKKSITKSIHNSNTF